MNKHNKHSNLTIKKRLVDIFLNERFVQLLKDYCPNIILNGNCFCPFHDDVNKPSAKVYVIPNGENFLYCYADRKIYKASDLLLQYDKKRFEEEYKQAYKLLGAEDLDKLEFYYFNELFQTLDYTKTKLDFRGHRIGLKEFLTNVINLANKQKENNKKPSPSY